MSHNIFIPFDHAFLTVIDNAKGHLPKLTECILNNNLSIWMIIKLYTFIIFAVCGTGLVMDSTNVCVCAAEYYETVAGTSSTAPTCAECPPGSTTDGATNSSACGKYD